jgi:protein SCO1/2
MKKSTLGLITGSIAGIVIAIMAVSALRPHTYHGTLLQSPMPAKDFELNGIQLSDYQGKVVALFFGYTFCPDVCPTSLATLGKAMDILGTRADDIQVIFVSVDTQRDTPERLTEYVTHFDERFIGVTGTAEEILTVSSLYGIYFEAQPASEDGSYLVDHTATILVIDRSGSLKLVLPYNISPEDVAADLREILR